MKVSDILRVKGGTLYTVSPDETLGRAVETMAQFDIGSLAVMEHGELVGMLTFRELIDTLARNGGKLDGKIVRTVMDDHPMTCTPETELDQVRPMMLEKHTRYMPVMDNRMLMGVISFYGQGRGGQPELREQDAQGLHPRLAGGRSPVRSATAVEGGALSSARRRVDVLSKARVDL